MNPQTPVRTPWTLPKIGFFAVLAAVLIVGGLATLSLISDHTESPAAATPSAQRLTADQYHDLVRGNIPTLADRSDAQPDRPADSSAKANTRTAGCCSSRPSRTPA